MEIPKKLTSQDLAFGIGRKASDEELKEFLNKPKAGKRKDALIALEEIKKRQSDKYSR